MAVFSLTAGIDSFAGPNETNSITVSDPGFLTSTDTISGGLNTDFLSLAPGSYTAAQFAGVTSIENISFFGGLTSVLTLTANLAATAKDRGITVQTDGPLTLDASAWTAADTLYFVTSSTFAGLHITAGAGNDFFSLSKPLHAGDTFNGGDGYDQMYILTGTDLGVKVNGSFANIERFVLLNGSSVTIAAGYSLAGGVVDVTLNDGTTTLIVETGATTAVSALSFTGTDKVIISSQVIRDDEFIMDVVSLAATDVFNAGGGTGDVLSFRNSGTVAQSQLAGVSATEIVKLGVGASNSITLNAAMLTNVASGAITVIGASEMDVVNAASFATGQAVRAYGYQNADTLTGGAGNDLLDGGSEADTMAGGLGNDYYYVDTALDVVTEAVGGGTDYIYSSVSLSLAANVERLTLTGTLNIDATGRSAQADVLTGNSGNNILNGLTGNDVMRGGKGNDTYYVDSAADLVEENAGYGTDAIKSTVTLSLTANTERLYLIGTNAINGTGQNVSNDLIVGNSNVNRLNGLTGNDTLTGGSGSDSFLFNTALNAATNHDTITDFNVPADTIQLENAIFTLLVATGTLSANLFEDNSIAGQNGSEVIVYDRANGDIYYDTNGTLTAGGLVLFADVTNGTVLTNADFLVI